MDGGGGSDDDCERGTGFVVTSWVLAALSVIAVLLRLYCRIRTRPYCGVDDYLILFASCIGVACAASITVHVHYGFGRRFTELTNHDKQQAVKWEYIVEVLAFIAVFFIRISVCFFVIRLSKLLTRSPWPERSSRLAMLLSLISTMTLLIAFSVQCRPITDAWSSNPLQCIVDHIQSMLKAMLAANVLDAFTNAILLLLPIYLIRGRTFTLPQKLHLTTIWIMGLIPVAASVARIQLAAQQGDVTHDYLGPAYLGTCEVYFGIIAASLPCLKPLFHSTWPSSNPHSSTNLNDHHTNNSLPDSPMSTTTINSLFPSTSTSTSKRRDAEKDSLTHYPSPMKPTTKPWQRQRQRQKQKQKRPSLTFPWLNPHPTSSSESSTRNNSLSAFPDLVPQIGRSSVVKRMDVQVELSRATDSEVALTDKELYASWEDPPDDPDVIEPLGSIHRSTTPRGVRNATSSRVNVPRRCTTAVAEALEISYCPRAKARRDLIAADAAAEMEGRGKEGRRWFR